MHLKNKLAVLEGAYEIYGKFIARYDLACEKHCADCCTCNVTMTTLEAFHLVDALSRHGKKELLRRLASAPEKRFKPELTFNKIAAMCARGMDVPEEPCDPSWGRCPFLENRECLFYSHRPFGCRCMSSRSRCSETGFADMPSLVMTVNDLFMQFIEHVDAGGYSGNFTDILSVMADGKNRRLHETGRLVEASPPLTRNVSIGALMVPPEHRKKIEPIYAALQEIFSARG